MPTRIAARRQRSRLAGVSVTLLVAAMIAVVGAAPSSADPSPAPAARRVAERFAWSPAQVRALIGEIQRARRHGLTPADYGLAALRGELGLCEELWNTPGSRQLDVLARTSALALANDYRRRSAASSDPVRPAELDAALGAGRIGAWLAEQAPAGQGIS